MSRSIEESAQPFKASITALRTAATLTGDGVGVGLGASGVTEAAGLLLVCVFVVVLCVSPRVLFAPDCFSPSSSQARRPATARTRTVAAIVTGMMSALLFGLCGVVTRSCAFIPVGR